MQIAWRIALILLTGFSFILMHELGHWTVAEAFSLDPQFVLGGANSGILGLAVGVMHNPASAGEQTMIILGATLLPMLVVVAAAGAAHFTGSETAVMVAEIYLLLIVVNLVPIPGVGQLDSNRLMAAVLPP
ncbi:MAG: hypothetical protein V1887_01945 [Candidatus Aenigmatarchaeota archaeon]